MRLFVLLSRVPWPLEKGDKLRAYHQLKHLAAKHEVFLCCLSDQKIHPDAIRQLKLISPNIEIIYLNKFLIGWRLFLSFFSSKPFQVHYFFQMKAARRVESLIAEFKPDHIYCQLIRTSEYVKNLHQYKKTIDYMDALSAGSKRRAAASSYFVKWFFNEEAKRLMHYENLIFDYFDHHVIISEQDQDLIFHPQRKKIVVIPNGVDSAFFTPAESVKKYDLVFTGNMSYAPNVSCALMLVNEILPIVKKHKPDIKLLIAGANPSAAVLSLASDSVVITGWLNDIRSAYRESKIFVAPMFTGSGMQNKLLEAMCMRLPCITSPLAAAAFGNSVQNALCIAASPQEFAEAILSLIKDEKLAGKYARNGQEFVNSNYDWQHSVDVLDNLLQSS